MYDVYFAIFTKELVQYTFIRNSGYKENILMVPMSSLYADFSEHTRQSEIRVPPRAANVLHNYWHDTLRLTQANIIKLYCIKFRTRPQYIFNNWLLRPYSIQLLYYTYLPFVDKSSNHLKSVLKTT